MGALHGGWCLWCCTLADEPSRAPRASTCRAQHTSIAHVVNAHLSRVHPHGLFKTHAAKHAFVDDHIIS
jgi:hypothetical protein